jgi:hypothetical protein
MVARQTELVDISLSGIQILVKGKKKKKDLW